MVWRATKCEQLLSILQVLLVFLDVLGSLSKHRFLSLKVSGVHVHVATDDNYDTAWHHPLQIL